MKKFDFDYPEKLYQSIVEEAIKLLNVPNIHTSEITTLCRFASEKAATLSLSKIVVLDDYLGGYEWREDGFNRYLNDESVGATEKKRRSRVYRSAVREALIHRLIDEQNIRKTLPKEALER